MFYNRQDILKHFNCSMCKESCKSVVKILPCSNRICVQCEENGTALGVFACCLCDSEHVRPRNGFVNDTVMESLLKLNPIDVSRGEVYDNGMKMLHDLRKTIEDLKENIENSEEKIASYCAYVRDEIDLATESKIAELHKARDGLMAKIDRYERKCLNNIKAEKNLKFKDLVKTLNGLTEKLERWSGALNVPSITDAHIKEITEEGEDESAKLKANIEVVNDITFSANKIGFISNEKVLADTCLGGLYYGSDYRIVSNIKEKKPRHIKLDSLSTPLTRGSNKLIDCFSNGHIVIVYKNDQNYNIALVDQNGNEICYMTLSACITYVFGLCVTSDDNFVIAVPSHEKIFLILYDRCFVDIGQIEIDHDVKSMQSYGNQIYIVSEKEIFVYDEDLMFVRKFGQTTDINSPFYFTKSCRTVFKENYMYTCFTSGLIANNLDTGYQHAYVSMEADIDLRLFEVISNEFYVLGKMNTICILRMDGKMLLNIDVKDAWFLDSVKIKNNKYLVLLDRLRNYVYQFDL